MQKWLIGVLAALMFSSTACQSTQPPGNTGEIKIWHIVIVRLNHPGDADAQQKLVAASKTFRSIPGVRVVYVGKVIAGDRPHQDSSFDVGLVMGFATKEDMAAYVAHPTHVKAVNEVLKPLAKDYTSYDFANQ